MNATNAANYLNGLIVGGTQLYSWVTTVNHNKWLKASSKNMKVSVIIPCYNFGEFIEQSILSAVNQITNFEYEIFWTISHR